MPTGRLARFCRLTRQERRFLAAAWAGLVLARLGVAVLPFRMIHRWAERGPRPTIREGAPDVERAAELVEAAARHHLVGTTCLTRALVLCALLRRRGRRARLVVGCARAEGGFEAHAWVEEGGRAVAAAGSIDRFEALLGGPAAPCRGAEARGANAQGG